MGMNRQVRNRAAKSKLVTNSFTMTVNTPSLPTRVSIPMMWAYLMKIVQAAELMW